MTFDSHIKTKSVTLKGDVFDPAGTLTGGKNIFLKLSNPVVQRPDISYRKFRDISREFDTKFCGINQILYK